ncbi:MAG: hypothetical protein AAF610_04325 [Pseudomonadota bacterium]
MKEQRTVCHTPTPGKQPTSIPTWKYKVVRDAIRSVVPHDGPGIVAKDLPTMVAGKLSSDALAELGSVAWHTTVVKLNMEVEGELARVTGARPQRLVRC